MKNALGAAAALLALGAAAGCTSTTMPFEMKPGVLPPGTAQLTVNGHDVGPKAAVQCVWNERLTTIKIGDEPSGAIAMVSNTDELAVEWVRIRDLNGFTGSYNQGLGGKAQVRITSSTYQISGTADGFNSASPSRPATGKFTIGVSC